MLESERGFLSIRKSEGGANLRCSRAYRECHLKIDLLIKQPICSHNCFPFLCSHSAQEVAILIGHSSRSGVRISPDCHQALQGPKHFCGISDPTCLPGIPATTSCQTLLLTTLHSLVPSEFPPQLAIWGQVKPDCE